MCLGFWWGKCELRDVSHSLSPVLRGLAFVHCMATLRITYIEDAFWNQANLIGSKLRELTSHIGAQRPYSFFLR